MDTLTHMLVGAAVAQLPTQPLSDLNWQRRAGLGAVAAIFPDIDYLLFLVDPLEFIAYWHRAETHSLLLAPLWAWLLAQGCRRLFAWQDSTYNSSYSNSGNNTLLFSICLAAIVSHIVIDSLNTFGTQWFAPLSDQRFSWDLLFVVDGYFTLCVVAMLFLLIRWQHQPYRVFSLSLPCGYLAFVLLIKLTVYEQIPQAAGEAERVLLPQPFSPLYWQVIQTRGKSKGKTFDQAYVRLADDVLASRLSESLGLTSHQQYYRPATQPDWRSYSIAADSIQWHTEVENVWTHPKFKAFRDFAGYPVFFAYQQLPQRSCVWFSDLRYHWPNIVPAFRYGMCRSKDQPWQRYRKRYLSREQMDLIE